MGMIRRRGNRQNPADRLDPIRRAMIINEGDHVFDRRSSSASAKYADALRRISFAWRSSRFSCSRAFSFADISDVTPALLPASTSAFRTHSFNEGVEHPIFRRSTRSPASATDARARDPAPAEPLARAPRGELVRRFARHGSILSGVSATDVPSSACFGTNAICASVNFDAFMELSLSRLGIISGKFQFQLT